MRIFEAVKDILLQLQVTNVHLPCEQTREF
jgi:hypothetical protein